MEPFYRATLRLERVEPYVDRYDSPNARATEISAHTVTGDAPDDAMVQMCAHADSLYDWHQTQADQVGTLDEAALLTDGALLERLRVMFRDQEEQQARADAQKAIEDVIAAMPKQPAEPDTKPFVACKAPDPLNPNFFCGRRRGHPEVFGCDYMPVEELPASADDEGDETAARPDSKACPCDQFCPDGERCDGLTTHEGVAQLNAEQRDEEHPDDELGRASAKLLVGAPACVHCGEFDGHRSGCPELNQAAEPVSIDQ